MASDAEIAAMEKKMQALMSEVETLRTVGECCTMEMHTEPTLGLWPVAASCCS